MTAIGPSPHDDHLYLDMAKRLLSGEWLGAYNHMTLAKGPFYAIWIAASFGLGIPLLVTQHLLYAAACAVFVAALAPALRGTLARTVLFAVLFFNPATFADPVGTRVLREGVYPALTLLVLGCALAIPLRGERPIRSNAPWAVGLGTSLAALWLCREERIWIVPALFFVAVWAAVKVSSQRRTVILLGAGVVAVFVALVGAVVVKNWSHYGVPVITEFTEGQMPDAYAALGRVRHAAERPRIPLPAETRLRIYAVSPLFAELQPFMEGNLGRDWSKVGCDAVGVCDDIAAGWLMWALRDAAAAAGHYRDAGTAARYWAGVRDEVASACRDGRLACGGFSLGFLPPMRLAYLAAFPGTFLHGVAAVASFQDMAVHPSPSIGPDPFLVDFRDLTRARLAPFSLARPIGSASGPARGAPGESARSYPRGVPKPDAAVGLGRGRRARSGCRCLDPPATVQRSPDRGGFPPRSDGVAHRTLDLGARDHVPGSVRNLPVAGLCIVTGIHGGGARVPSRGGANPDGGRPPGGTDAARREPAAGCW